MIRLWLTIIFLLIVLNVFNQNNEANSFIEYVHNKGQWERNILYRGNFKGGQIFLESDGFTFLFFPAEGVHKTHRNQENDSLNFHCIRMEFLNTTNSVQIQPEEKSSYYHNYYLGNDASKWTSNVPLFKYINYKNIYPGINIQAFSNKHDPRFDFIIQPGHDPSNIKIKITGQDKMFVTEKKLVIETSVGRIEQSAPFAYQLINGLKRKVECSYVLDGNILSFNCGRYNKNETLIIDPTLVFATYTGSVSDNWGMTATYDNSGNAYTAGIIFGWGYPTTTGAFQTAMATPTSGTNNPYDISISKFNVTGSSLLYSTYLGGASIESPQSIVVDMNNELVLLGRTNSTNFPTTSNAFDNTLSGAFDLVVCKFNQTGTALQASTYIGGSVDDGVNISQFGLSSLKYNYSDDARGAVIIDNNNNVLVGSCTQSSDFPVTSGCNQPVLAGMQDGCVFKMNSSLSNLVYSTFLGGSLNDAVYNIALDSKQCAYVTGGTESSNFPATNGVLHPTHQGGIDGFITHLSFGGNSILHSTFLGTALYEQSFFVQTDKVNNVYVYGQCSGNYPITSGTYSNANSGQFIHGMDSTLSSTIFSTEFGTGAGTPDIVPSAFLIDNCENIYVSGWGGILYYQNNLASTTFNLPVTPGAFMTSTDGNDFYFLVMQKNATALTYATFFGGPWSEEHVDGGTSRFDKAGIIYQAICESCGGSDDMPTTPGVWSNQNGSINCNNALVKFKFDMLATVAQALPTPALTSGCAPFNLSFSNTSLNATSYFWDFGDGTTSNSPSPSHTYSVTGNFQIMLVASNASTCNTSDTTYISVEVRDLNLSPLSSHTICSGDSVQLNASAPAGVTYSWQPASSLTNSLISNPIAFPNITTQYILSVTDSFCTLNDSLVVTVMSDSVEILIDSTIACVDDTITLSANTTGVQYLWNTGETSQTIQTINAGIFSVTSTDANGCVGVDSITINDFTHVQISGFDTIICNRTSVQLITTPGEFTYQWEPNQSLNNSTVFNPFASPPTTTIYTVTIYNGPCPTTGTYTVIVLPSPYINIVEQQETILPGESVTLNVTSDDSCTWYPAGSLSCNTCFSPTAFPDSTTTFYAITTNAAGCSHIDSVKIYVTPTLYIPNAFTPNDDNLNNYFKPVFSGYTKLEFTIYNRWGEKLYYSNELSAAWDGKYKGTEVQQDVYVYHLIATDLFGVTIRKVGHVTLIR